MLTRPAGLHSIRTCPFCRVNHGTPRRYVMECPEPKDYAEELCDAAERALFSFQCPQTLIDAANAHVAGLSTLSSHPAPELCVSKWPILSAWRWLVRIPAREVALRSPPPGSIVPEPESAMNLAYRCVLPSSIGYAIHKMEVPHVSEPTVEEVATLLDPSRLCKED